MSKAIYQMVTDRILEKLKQGLVPWRMPWSAEGLAPANLISKRPYRGINTLMLGMSGYGSPWWLTRKQIQQLGGHINKGEKCTPVIFWRWVDIEDEAGEEVVERRAYCRYYKVWNLVQTEGVKAPAGTQTKSPDFVGIPACEKIVSGYKSPPELSHGFAHACYRPPDDIICMPDHERFEPAEEYYSTLFHELVHSTGHRRRLARPELMDSHSFGNENYSREELTAEIGSAFLCTRAGIAPATLENSMGYIGSWYKRLRKEPGLIISASQRAQKAADWILGSYHNQTANPKRLGDN